VVQPFWAPEEAASDGTGLASFSTGRNDRVGKEGMDGKGITMTAYPSDNTLNVQKAGGSKANPKRAGSSLRPGIRVHAARMTNERAEEVLSSLRELLTGPQRKLAEARYSEMVDILEEQDQAQQQNFSQLSGQISELTSGISKLQEAFTDLQQFYDKAHARHDQQLADLRAHVERAMAAQAEEMNMRFNALSETALRSMNESLNACRRDLERLTAVVESNKQTTVQGLELLKSNSMTAIDQRIAQWRAEREDERVEDLKAVADSFSDIGQRLAALRLNSYTIS
jgi:polyhydroxyalkanoate synthesis regulator phasin